MTDKKTYAKPAITDLGSVAALTLSHQNAQGVDFNLANNLPLNLGPVNGPLLIGS